MEDQTFSTKEQWMTIGPRSDGYSQKIPLIGRVKPRFHGPELGSR